MKRLFWLALALGIIWLGVYLVPSAKPKKSALKWPKFAHQQIEKIAFGNFTLQKTNDWWVIVKRNKFPASRDKVEDFLSFLEQNPPQRVLDKPKPEKLPDFGLDKKQSLQIKTGTKVIVFNFGGTNPSMDGIYALCSLWPNKLLLLPYTYKDKLETKAKDFYELNLFAFKDDQLLRLQKLIKQDVKWELKRKEESEFVFVKPKNYQKYKVDTAEATSLFFNLATLKAKDLQAGLPANATYLFGFHYTLQDFSQGKVKFYAQNGTYLAQLPPKKWIYVLDQSKVKVLDKTAFQLRDRHFLNFSQDQVKRVEISTPQKSITVLKDKDKWLTLEERKEFPAISFILWELKDVQYKAEPLTYKPKECKTQVLDIILKDYQNKVIYDLSFWQSGQKDSYWLSDGKKWYLVNGEVVSEVQQRLKQN